MGTQNRNFVQSLLKGLDILATVAEAEAEGLRLVDIAERLELKTPTTHNLVQTLLHRRYLVRSNGNRYRLGPAFLELARRSGSGQFMRQAEKVLADLSRQFPEATVTLAQVIGDEIHFRRRISPDRPGIMQRPIGLVFRPYANASGLVCLAFGAEDTLALLRERYPFHECAAHLWDSPRQLSRFLEEVRRKGYAVPPFPGQEGLRVAFPIMDAYGSLVATLGASVPWEAVHASGGRQAVVDAASGAAQKLGTA